MSVTSVLHDFTEEHIVAAAILCGSVAFGIPKTVYSLAPPANHHDILNFIHLKYSDTMKYVTIVSIQGFITSKGTFVNRAEAKRIAVQANQVKQSYIPYLYSEDMW